MAGGLLLINSCMQKGSVTKVFSGLLLCMIGCLVFGWLDHRWYQQFHDYQLPLGACGVKTTEFRGRVGHPGFSAAVGDRFNRGQLGAVLPSCELAKMA